MICVIQHLGLTLTVSDVCLKLGCFQSTSSYAIIAHWRYHTLCAIYIHVSLNYLLTASEQCLTFPPTQYRLYARRFLQVKRPNQQYQSTEGDATKEKENNENN